MKIKLILSFVFIFFYYAFLSAQSDKVNVTNVIDNIERNCESPWKNDSIGSTGYRAIVFELCYTKCYTCVFKDINWDELEKILGTPNEEFVKKKKIIKRYYCNEVNKFATGHLLLDVIVNSEGEVVGTKFFKVPAD